MTKALLIVNPSSGKEKGRSYQKKAEQALLKRFCEVEVQQTKKQGDATDFAFKAAEQGYDAVIAMGGDGTLNETINGLAVHDKRPAFGFVPLGTVNDLARSAGIPLKPKKAIEALKDAVLEPMDIGKIGNTYFMNVLAIGMIAQAVDQVSIKQKTKFGFTAYFMEGLKAFNRKEVLTFSIEFVDGNFEGEAALVVAGLTSSVGGMKKWAPEAELADGLLHVFILKKLDLLNAPGMIHQLMRGKLKDSSSVEYIQTAKMKIRAENEGISVNVDGDSGPELPVSIEVLPSHLQILLPKK
ncbi:diacylglycerol kinase family protein [Listeria sp. PSOL-1]|uniref:diacylglycerol/lipid kinase family protein n=1 Tax=Listeria sp. PSOL-1 TaxID=1844999 RepID=UPI0013D127CB|nr:diacylglycerol kinase family protein [Listeria sp. PSOL-1]